MEQEKDANSTLVELDKGLLLYLVDVMAVERWAIIGFQHLVSVVLVLHAH